MAKWFTNITWSIATGSTHALTFASMPGRGIKSLYSAPENRLIMSSIMASYISKLSFGQWEPLGASGSLWEPLGASGSLWEPLGASESCQIRISEWSNFWQNWTDAMAFRCTREHLGVQTSSLRMPTWSLGVFQCTGDKAWSTDCKLWSTNDEPGHTDHKTGSMPNQCNSVWEEHHLLWECCWCAWK